MKGFYLLSCALLFLCFFANAQDSSLDNYTGNWTDDASWTSGTAPPFDNVIEDLTINGYITLQAGNRIDLTIGGGDVFTIEDTLVIADPTLTSRFFTGNTVIVNGLLVVHGNLNVNTGTTFTVNSGGIVAVGGNFGKFGAGDPDLGAGTVYVEGTSGYTDFSDADDLEADGHGNIGDFLDGTSTTLPVELTYFRSEVKEDQVNLEWATSSELNNEGFDIEKSKNGLDFYKIGFVKGHGTVNEEKRYAFTDNLFDVRAYYRLKQLDFDGAFEYSEIIEATTYYRYGSGILIYPNPVVGNESLSVAIDIEGTSFVNLSIYSLLGHLIHSDVIYLREDLQNFQYDLSEEKLNAGQYWLQIETETHKYNERFSVK